jgi:hypothetical protein
MSCRASVSWLVVALIASDSGVTRCTNSTQGLAGRKRDPDLRSRDKLVEVGPIRNGRGLLGRRSHRESRGQ